MAETISQSQLEQWQKSIDSGGVQAVEQVYAELYAMGYNYGGWAGGVASGNLLSGQAALAFMEKSAQNGGHDLTPEQVDKIRIDMAINTLDGYISIAKENGGLLTEDFDYELIKEVHRITFEENGSFPRSSVGMHTTTNKWNK